MSVCLGEREMDILKISYEIPPPSPSPLSLFCGHIVCVMLVSCTVMQLCMCLCLCVYFIHAICAECVTSGGI